MAYDDEAATSASTPTTVAFEPPRAPVNTEGQSAPQGTDGPASGPDPDSNAAPRTGAPRRRSRGGRGRGRGGGGGARPAGAQDGSTQGPDDSDGPDERQPEDRQPADRTSVDREGPRPTRASAPRQRRPASDQPQPQPRPQARPQPRPKPSRDPESLSQAEFARQAEAAAELAARHDTGPDDEDDREDRGPALDAGPVAEGSPASAGPRKRSRRGGRGRGRGGQRPTALSADGGEDAPDDAAAAQRDEAEPDADAGQAPRKPRTRTRAATPKTETETGPGDGRKKAASPKEPGAARKPRSPKTSEKTEASENGDKPAKAGRLTLEERVAAGGPTRGLRSTRSRTGRDGRRRRDPQPVPPRITDKLMVITENGDRDQIAVLEGDTLVQHYVTRTGATSMVGNVYLGRVQNVLPGMEAAFIDTGRGRNGVLYAGEVNYSPEDIEGPAPRIEQLLKPGQAVMVQVTKDPMGGKGARLTANLSLAGRYLVLAPNQDLQGISRRLGDEARKRLKTLLKNVKPPEHGVIVRTAAEGATEEALEADLRRLLKIWDQIQATAKRGKAPDVLYEEPELTVRVVRDLFTDEEFRGLVTDSPRVHEKIKAYLDEVAPDLAEKLTLHQGKLPAFEEHRVVEQIHKALDKKVWLPSGGYLFIERTEAMTIIDVNTGKSVGKTNLEETVVNTNLEASREAARQLRLRDIGGIIVIDFIDMLLEKNKRQVEDTMRDALAVDKTRSQVYEIGPLGLMQVTRKRVSSGLVESFSETCPTCEGRGILLTYDVN